MGSVSQTFPSLTGWEQVRLCTFSPSSLSEDATFLCGAASVPDDTAALLSVELPQRDQKMLWLTLHFYRHQRLYRRCWAILTLLLVCVDHMKSSMMIMKKNLLPNFLPCSSGIALVSPCPHQSHNQLLDLFDIEVKIVVPALSSVLDNLSPKRRAKRKIGFVRCD